MPKITKAQKAVAGKVQPGKTYSADEALKLVKELAHAKFVARNVSRPDQERVGSGTTRQTRGFGVEKEPFSRRRIRNRPA